MGISRKVLRGSFEKRFNDAEVNIGNPPTPPWPSVMGAVMNFVMLLFAFVNADTDGPACSLSRSPIITDDKPG